MVSVTMLPVADEMQVVDAKCIPVGTASRHLSFPSRQQLLPRCRPRSEGKEDQPHRGLLLGLVQMTCQLLV